MTTISLSRFLLDEQRQKQANPSDLRLLVEVVARAIKAISINVGKGALVGVLGEAGTGNVQGEAQKKLDVIANTLDRELGSFILTREDIRIPEDTSEFAANMSNQRFWEPPVQRYVGKLLAGRSGPRGKDFNMRWVASMVTDVYRILDVVPTALHQRVAVFLGSKNEVEVVTRYHAS
jgi:fructose-1,6-bisphosphatase